MSQPESHGEASSVLSSPSSSILELLSPKEPSSPTPPSSRSGRAPRYKLPAPGSRSSSPSTPSDLSAREMNARSASKQSPKRSHSEVQDEDDVGNPKKCRVTSSRDNAIAAEQACSSKAKAPSKTKDAAEMTSQSTERASESRPSRARKPPKEFWVVDDEKEQKPSQKIVQPKKPSSKVFDPIFITSNSTSRLGKADVYHMLLEDSAWTSLNRSQQKDLLSMLPPDIANQGFSPRLITADEDIPRPLAFTLSNDCFRTDVAKFKEDLKNGHLAKTWQAAAEQAVVERASGKYDKWKAEEAELWWGQKSK